ncbi:MAG: hypothetical protein QM758_16105 [Armatimonas sp.]
MKQTILSVAALALALPALAQQKPEQILQKYITASGGTAAYAKVKSQIQKGTISMPAQGITGNFTMSYKSPAKMVMNASLPGVGEIGQGYDGKNGWARDPFMGTRTLKGDELAQILNELTLSNDPASYKKVFSKMEILPPGKVGKVKALRLKLTPKTGSPQTLYFDATSYLLIRRDADITSPQGKIPSESYFTDYRTIDGVKMPFKTRTLAGPAEQIMTVTEVKNNIPIEDSIFAKPASEPAGKTKM